ncbi:aspartic peptidase domain-containing protein [Mycena albidolilacea]|uniref:Aspartic peptidase domain-containing protein n=1 Tax=Mycena albidolilacea TaxID=1033008 RepID=A0AAD6ZQD9_9AGAR|nr:aspartic peptidase domain-containing protein [Mycena albidolilacea]
MLAAASFLLCFAAVLCAADPLHIPLSLGRRRPQTVEDGILDAERTRARYASEANSPNGPLARRATVATVPLTDQLIDSSYFCTLSIGTPGQVLKLELDLGSGDSWVAESPCSLGCTSSMDLYDPTRSSTSNSTQFDRGIIVYGESFVSGTIVKDTVRLVAADILPPNLVSGTSSGVLGMAYQETLSSQGPSFLQALLANGQLTSGAMSFWLNRFAGTANAQAEEANGGALTLGGSNASLYTGNIDFLTPTGSPNGPNWVLDVTEVTVQGKSVQITSGASALATFDLTTTLIAGPSSDVIALWAAVPGAVRSASQPGFFQFACTTIIKISVSFGGHLWPIDPADMNIGTVTQGSSQCLGAIYELQPGFNIINTDGAANWVFGSAFMKNVYTVFQPNPFSIGFAQLSSQALGPSPTAPSSKLKSSVPLGPIVGGAVGGVVLVVALVIVLCMCKRRSRRGALASHDSTSFASTRPVSQGDPQKFDQDEPPLPIVQYVSPVMPSPTLGRRIEPTHQAPMHSLSAVGAEYYVGAMHQPRDDLVHNSGGHIEPAPQPLIHSLSTVKQEQITAAHYYGATHQPSEDRVRNSGGLQLLPRLEHPESSLWPGASRTSGSSAVEGIQEVHRASSADSGAVYPTVKKGPQKEDVGLPAPPMYQQHDVV